MGSGLRRRRRHLLACNAKAFQAKRAITIAFFTKKEKESQCREQVCEPINFIYLELFLFCFELIAKFTSVVDIGTACNNIVCFGLLPQIRSFLLQTSVDSQ